MATPKCIQTEGTPCCASCGTDRTPDYWVEVVDPTGSRTLCAACVVGLLVVAEPAGLGRVSLMLEVALGEVTAR